MIADLFAVYMESLTAFYRGIFGGGIFKLAFFAFVMWWIFCRGRGSCCCRHCGCWCGSCRCDRVRMNGDDDTTKAKSKT